MARKAQIIGCATDWQGVTWDVRDRRPTRHGFDVLIGWPQGAERGKGGRGVAVIISAELASYLTETRLRDSDLPIGSTTIKRLRHEVGASWAWNDWWAARVADLLALTLEAFCSKHGCSMGAASQRRSALHQAAAIKTAPAHSE